MARLHALVVATVVAAAAPAAAELIAIPSSTATLELGTGWTPVTAAGIVVGSRSERGLVLAVTRAQVPNLDAWRARKREAYADDIERGISAAITGYRRTSRTLTEVRGVPVLDLEGRRPDGTTVVLRFVLYRTYALALALEIPRSGDIAPARAIAASFTP
ncbi:MAG: hypothetical protein JWP01_853 [Myxococcales bacterium]|nr:hypothetical protein [Myxococcales bacterium]